MPKDPIIERLIKRDRIITLGGVAILCALAWLYLLMGAGLGMSAWDMTGLALFPHQSVMDMAEMPGMDMQMPARASWGLGTWLLIIAMWWIMMIAMMTPSASPAILLYARVHRHAQAQGRHQGKLPPTTSFLAGYLLVWLGFSIVATLIYFSLERAGLISATTMGLASRGLSGTVLIAAGLYELSPLKHVCLSHCRSPVSFLTRHWRQGSFGVLRLGMMHGAYCVGCCWMLMILLFVGGVMNLIWIATLAILVLIEKTLPGSQWITYGVSIILIGWGLATYLV